MTNRPLRAHGAVDAVDLDIVRTAHEAARLDRPPLLVLDALAAFLEEEGLGTGPVDAQRIGEGSSNATFYVKRGDRTYVLRRPPRPPFPASAHNVVREAKLQVALGGLGLRTPKIVAICERTDFLGVPFYLMEYVNGFVLAGALPSTLSAVDERQRLAEDFVRTLVEIHAADVAAPELAPFCRPGNYLERQVRRFISLWEVNATREIPLMIEVGKWLRETMPETIAPTVVHGDYRLGNVLIGRHPPARVVAVLDWEMGAIGDPRADVGFMSAHYSDGRNPPPPLELSPATSLEGFPDRRKLVGLYSELSGRHLADLAWFEALALWKVAVVCEAIYARFLRGEIDYDPLAPRLEEGVPALAAAAARIAEVA